MTLKKRQRKKLAEVKAFGGRYNGCSNPLEAISAKLEKKNEEQKARHEKSLVHTTVAKEEVTGCVKASKEAVLEEIHGLKEDLTSMKEEKKCNEVKDLEKRLAEKEEALQQVREEKLKLHETVGQQSAAILRLSVKKKERPVPSYISSRTSMSESTSLGSKFDSVADEETVPKDKFVAVALEKEAVEAEKEEVEAKQRETEAKRQEAEAKRKEAEAKLKELQKENMNVNFELQGGAPLNAPPRRHGPPAPEN